MNGSCASRLPDRGPSPHKPILVDPPGPAGAAPAVVSRALLHRQPFNGIVNPFELAANAGGGCGFDRLDHAPPGGISYSMLWSELAWSGAVGRCTPSRAAAAHGEGLMPADQTESFGRRTATARLAAVLPASPFAALSEPQEPASSPGILAAGNRESNSEAGARASGPSLPATMALAALTGTRSSAQSDVRTVSQAALTNDVKYLSHGVEQATVADRQQPSQRPPVPPKNPFAEFRGACTWSAGSGPGSQASDEAAAGPAGQQAAEPPELPALGDGDAQWTWPVHRTDELLPSPDAIVRLLPPPPDSSFGAVGGGPALAAQRSGALVHAPCQSLLLVFPCHVGTPAAFCSPIIHCHCPALLPAWSCASQGAPASGAWPCSAFAVSAVYMSRGCLDKRSGSLVFAVPCLRAAHHAKNQSVHATGGRGLWNTDLDVAMPAELRRFSTVILSHARHRLLFPDPVEVR